MERSWQSQATRQSALRVARATCGKKCHHRGHPSASLRAGREHRTWNGEERTHTSGLPRSVTRIYWLVAGSA